MERATDVNLFTRRLANLPRKKLAGRAKRSANSPARASSSAGLQARIKAR